MQIITIARPLCLVWWLYCLLFHIKHYWTLHRGSRSENLKTSFIWYAVSIRYYQKETLLCLMYDIDLMVFNLTTNRGLLRKKKWFFHLKNCLGQDWGDICKVQQGKKKLWISEHDKALIIFLSFLVHNNVMGDRKW